MNKEYKEFSDPFGPDINDYFTIMLNCQLGMIKRLSDIPQQFVQKTKQAVNDSIEELCMDILIWAKVDLKKFIVGIENFIKEMENSVNKGR